jgi:hypothetical protein
VIIRSVVVLMVTLVPSLPVAAQQNQAVRFEIAMLRPFGGEAGSGQSASEEPNAGKASDQNYIASAPIETITRKVRPLSVYVLVGQRAVNSISTQTATAPIVEVRDERNMPVPGAEVIFQLPGAGPGGFFAGQQLTWTGTTDTNGQVVAADFVPNRETGSFTIRITARHDGRVANAIVEQKNSVKGVPAEGPKTGAPSGKRWSTWKIAALAIGGGAAAGGIIWATNRGGKPTIVLQPGTVSFGGPR